MVKVICGSAFGESAAACWLKALNEHKRILKSIRREKNALAHPGPSQDSRDRLLNQF